MPAAVHGTKPNMEETAAQAPDMYRKFVKYIALRDFVRNNRTLW